MTRALLAPKTAKVYGWALGRFEAYRATLPAPTPSLEETVRRYLEVLPFSKRRTHRAALRRRYPELNWYTMPGVIPPQTPVPEAAPVARGSYPPRRGPQRGQRWGQFQDVPLHELPPEAIGWTPTTRYHFWLTHERFTAFQATCPGLSLTEQVCRFLAQQRRSMGRCSRVALRAWFRRGEVDWSAVPRRREYRDEGRLYASILRPADELPQLLASLRTTRERVIVELCWTLRRAEVAALRWRDLDLTQGLVYVVSGKGGRSSWTLLTPGAIVALTTYRAETRPNPDQYVLPGRWGGMQNPTTINHLLRQIFKRAGLSRPWRNAHALRRTFATLYLRHNPGDLRGLQKLLRHENITTTTLYAFVEPEDLIPRMARVFGPFPGSSHGLQPRRGADTAGPDDATRTEDSHGTD